MFTELLLSNERWDKLNRYLYLHIQSHKLMRAIYEVSRRDVFSCLDRHASFIKIGSGIQNLLVTARGIHRHANKMVIA